LERWFSAQVEMQRRFRVTRECPFGTIGNEVTENDELIRQDLSLIFELVGNQLATFFIRRRPRAGFQTRSTKDSWPISAWPLRRVPC
jgi:hypothetical protein